MLSSEVVQLPDSCLDDNIIAAYIDGGLDDAQKVEVESHIDSCDECRTHLSSVAAATAVTSTDEAVDEHPPSEFCEQIGPYRLLHPIGVGGMGEVFEAEQLEPVKRRVALKIVKQGLGSKEVIARFDAERQALALMTHPNVAKIFDGGTSPSGRPYFVMELVHGMPITSHCDKEHYDLRQRLELFLKVCEGVQHAHHKAIIHRDLKPSNILVSKQDGKAAPKIIDFGVAKAMTQSLTERTLSTEFGKLVGTLAYMSPEQARMTSDEIDTRADVYSLGVILYELLVGVLPFELTRRGSELEVVLRQIREELPVVPSTRLASIGDKTSSVLDSRKTDKKSLRRLLKGDLDWITMKALEKEVDRRYGSPQELAADIRRYLNFQAVLASPPSARYRASKFIRRHRVGVGAAAVGVATLIAFATTMTMQAERISKQRDRANREATRANSEAERANLEAESAERVSAFLVGMFKVSNPGEARGNSLTARELLDRGAADVEKLADKPALQARLMSTISGVYQNLGLYAQAKPLVADALAITKELYGADHETTLKAMGDQAKLLVREGKYEEAEPLYLSLIETEKRVLGEDHEETLHATNDLGLVYLLQARYDESETLLRESFETLLRTKGPDDQESVGFKANLALLYKKSEKYDKAAPLMSEAYQSQRKLLGEDHPDTLITMNNLASLYREMDRIDEAETLFKENLELKKRVLGEDHPDTMTAAINVANLLVEKEKYAEAEPLYVAALAAQREALGDHPNVGISMHNLACMFRDMGKHADADSLFAESLKLFENKLGPTHPIIANSTTEWAKLKRLMGQDEEAASLDARAAAVAAAQPKKTD
jgi:non-specific serine/threonine protein kinase/serine/threonine-protein kinase